MMNREISNESSAVNWHETRYEKLLERSNNTCVNKPMKYLIERRKVNIKIDNHKETRIISKKKVVNCASNESKSSSSEYDSADSNETGSSNSEMESNNEQ